MGTETKISTTKNGKYLEWAGFKKKKNIETRMANSRLHAFTKAQKTEV